MHKILVVAGTAMAGVLAMTTQSLATSYEVDLTSGAPAVSSQGIVFWDFYNSADSCSAVDGFTPLYDGAFVGHGDAFDSGFVIQIEGNTYKDPDEIATLRANVISTGPAASVGGLKVNGVARAIQNFADSPVPCQAS